MALLVERKGINIGYANRELESKLEIFGKSLEEVNALLHNLFEEDSHKSLFGSSIDTYWTVHNSEAEADFIRMRERDGIRQITVKGKDRDSNLDRMEIDIDSTSDVSTITKLLTAVHGKPSGKVNKTYYVYWLGTGKHTTVCCYEVTDPIGGVYIEVETTSSDKMLALEAKVLDTFRRQDIRIERASGSLYEMYILGQKE